MNPFVKRELRELAPFAAPLAAGAAAFGWFWSDIPRFQTGALALGGLVGGAALGIAHGLLDRRARGDAFLLHRPSAPAAIHGARTATGAGAAIVLALTMCAARAASPDTAWVRSIPTEPPQPVTALAVVVCVAGALLGWSLLRLCASRRSLWLAGALSVVLPTLVVAEIAVGSTGTPPVAVALVVAALLTAGSIADLSADSEVSR